MALNAKAINPLFENGKIIGYTLEDEHGNRRDAKSDLIMRVIESKTLNVINLIITENKELVMLDNNENNNLEKEEKLTEKATNIKNSNESIKNEGTELVKKSVNTSSKIDRLHELVKTLNEARRVYEQGTDELMSNYEYDKLYDELLNLEKDTGIILAGSPTVEVGYEVVSALPKEKHSSKMLSLDKTKDRDALAGWLNGRDGILSWKLDGLTVVITYDNGKLIKAVTRGNGEIGELVTNNAKHFKNLPKQIDFKGKLVIRGEAVISYSNFNKINNNISNPDEKYKNPRNLCSGSVRQLDSSITSKRNVEWFAFDIIELEGLNLDNKITTELKWLKDRGFSVVDHMLVNPDNVLNGIEQFSNQVSKYDIPTDGLVLTFNDKAYGKSLGQTSKFPRHSIAFKWADETAITTLERIEWQVGRTGIITPVAIFKPVELEGTTVTRASLHNLSVLYDTLGQPYVGQRIEVYKANMIIPCVLRGEKIEE